MYGNVSELRDRGWEPEKSYLFSLTTPHNGIGLTGDMVTRSGKHLISEVFGAFQTCLENRRE